MPATTPSRPHRPWIHAAILTVVGWRVAAYYSPHPAGTDPTEVRAVFALMGLWFAACGVWVGLRVPGRSAAVFAGFGLAGGLHWGGPLAWGSEAAQILLLAVYVVVSTALAQSLFLHLAVCFPEPLPSARHRGWLTVIYLPVLVGVALLVALLLSPTAPWLMNGVIALFPVGVIYSLVAGAVWIRRWFRSGREERSTGGWRWVVPVLVASWLPHALVSSIGPVVPPYDGLFDLPMGAIPAVLALALNRARAAPYRLSGGADTGPS